ncbi:MAG: hypothetical protein WCI36_02195 [bacterium]
MNKKIASEFAIGIIVLLAIVIGGIFLVENRKQMAITNNTPSVEDSKNQDVANGSVDQGNVDELTQNFQKDPCKGHMYDGEVALRGRYVLDSVVGEKKEWLFKVAKDDLIGLPVQITDDKGKNVNELLKIADADPALIAKLKKATDEKPETLIIKGYYLHCEGGPVVSIAPAKLALAKYLKKTE